MKGFLPTVTLGTARAPRVPCSARAITIGGLGLGAIVGAVAATVPQTRREEGAEPVITHSRDCQGRRKMTVSKIGLRSVCDVGRYLIVTVLTRITKIQDPNGQMPQRLLEQARIGVTCEVVA